MSYSSSKEQGGGGGRKKKDIWTLIRSRLCFKVNASTSSSTEQKQSEIPNDSNANNDSSASASASLIASNVDLLTLILTRLPSKSLLVFKSVSKEWLSMIADPHFVRQHFIQNPRSSIPGLFWGDASVNFPKKPTYYYISLVGYANSIRFDVLTFAKDRFGIKIIQSCGGLLLCKRCSRFFFDFTYYVYNPFTNKYKTLPLSELGASCKFIYSVSLAFDPLKSPHYKVITVWKDDKSSSHEYVIEVYNSETSSWRMSGFYSCTAQAESIPMTSGVFWNGSLHWCHGGGGYIVSFDIDHELVRVWPQEFDGRRNFQIAEYGGHFYLLQTARPFSNRISIFKMDANFSWNFKGQVDDVSLHQHATFLRFSADSIVFIIDRGEESESTKVVMLSTDGVVFSYELKDLICEKISLKYDLSARPKFRYGVKFHQYIESLACV